MSQLSTLSSAAAACKAPIDTKNARSGGIGVIHRNLSLARQVTEEDKGKRSANGVILDPVTLTPGETIGEAREVMRTQNISGLPVCEGNRVVGILTSRDCRVEAGETPRIRP